jgi:uncharacterized membrane protein
MLDMIAAAQVRLGQGGPMVQIPLLTHVVAGMAAITTGYVAMVTAKGGPAHRRYGRWFVYAMLVMGLVGASIATFERKPSSVFGGLTAAYMVTTALLTVRGPTVVSRRVEMGAMLFALATGAIGLVSAISALSHGVRVREGVPVAMSVFMSCVVLACGLGDVRVLMVGGLRGSARLVRHLWRMCFAMFIATGSFFLGQAKVIPKPLRVMPLLAIPALAPLVLMLYWLLRPPVVRAYRRLRLVDSYLLRYRRAH